MLEDIRVFVNVVRLNGFSNAARHLKLPTSTVSRTIARLEASSGTKLLVRSTRSLKPTAAGLLFFESCLAPVQALEEAVQSLSGTDSLAVGLIRLTASEDIGEHIISPVIGVLARTHPRLTFELSYTDENLDLVNEGIDIAVRMGRLKDSQLFAKKVGVVTLALVASPGYLESRDEIVTPDQLIHHDCLTFLGKSFNRAWELQSGSKKISVPIAPKAKSNQMTGLISIALQSAGIAYVPLYLCKPYLKSGRLVRVLPDWEGAGIPISIVSPMGLAKSARHKIVSEHLAREISKRLS